jgi:hypothetical protein
MPNVGGRESRASTAVESHTRESDEDLRRQAQKETTSCMLVNMPLRRSTAPQRGEKSLLDDCQLGSSEVGLRPSEKRPWHRCVGA